MPAKGLPVSSVRPSRRPRLLAAGLSTLVLLTAAVVALPAAGSGAAPGAPGSPAASGTPSPAGTPSLPRTRVSGDRTATPRPHCTGCVEHQTFGFEDATTQRWQIDGHTSIRVVTSAGADEAGGTSPRSGRRMLEVTGVGNAGSVRWPATTDTRLSGFQVRVWVRSRERSGTVALRVTSDDGDVTTRAALVPGVWTPLTTPRVGPGRKGGVIVKLAQEEYCRDGDLGTLDIDDAAVASTFDPEPPVWRSDDASLLAPALPVVHRTMLPCPTPSSTPTPSPTAPPTAPTVLDFEDGTTQGWQGVGKVTLSVVPQARRSGRLGLRIGGLAAKQNVGAARLDVPVSAYGGEGRWFRLRMNAAGGAPVTTLRRTCGPSKIVRGATLVNVSVAGATALVGRAQSITPAGTTLTVWFQLPDGATHTVLDLTVPAGSKVGPVSIDDVVLDRSATIGAISGTSTPQPQGVSPLC